MLLLFVPEIHKEHQQKPQRVYQRQRGRKSCSSHFSPAEGDQVTERFMVGFNGPHYSPKHLCHRTVRSMHTHAQHTQISDERQAGPTNRMTKCIQVVTETKSKYLATEIYGEVPCCTQEFETTHLYSHYTVSVL